MAVDAPTHPFRAAWDTRDLDAFADALAPDVVLHSPIVSKPFEGEEAAVELYRVAFEHLGAFEITDEFGAGDTHAFFWRAYAGGRTIEGVDLIRHDEAGKIAEVRVSIRPLVDLATFAAVIGPPLARRRGRLNGLLVTVLVAPLRLIFAAIDQVSSRLATPG
jgi:ketosteroid isomerase-like protein